MWGFGCGFSLNVLKCSVVSEFRLVFFLLLFSVDVFQAAMNQRPTDSGVAFQLTKDASAVNVDNDISRGEFAVLVGDAVGHDGFDLQEFLMLVVAADDGETKSTRTLFK